MRMEVTKFVGGIYNDKFWEIFGFNIFNWTDKRHVFEDIKTHIWKKIQEWKGKLLLQAGKEILVNVVALAIP